MLAGVNGAGKSTVVGENLRAQGGEYFNPDEATKNILAANPGSSLAEANSTAWGQGTRLLQHAITNGLDYTFETTLGGTTIVRMLGDAIDTGLQVHVAYVGLQSPEMHIARVRARVARGGHDIPEEKIRERYDKSRQHLIEVLPRLSSLDLYDNSIESPPEQARPELRPLLRMEDGKIVYLDPPLSIPDWAKPVVMAAMKIGMGPIVPPPGMGRHL
ncbi:hypothetical protein BH11GEM2_BH11GEM2_35690 [soil metagenome]